MNVGLYQLHQNEHDHVPLIFVFLLRDSNASTVYAMTLCLSLCLSADVCLCVSVISRYSTKTAKCLELIFWHWGVLPPIVHYVVRKFE